MNNRFGALMLSLAVGLASVSARADVKWMSDEKAAFTKAKLEHRLLLVDVVTDSCVWCKRMEAYAYKEPDVIDLSSGFVTLRVNAEKEGKALATKYKVAVFPMVLVLRPDGTQVSRLMGYFPGPDFADRVRVAVDSAKELAGVKHRLAVNPLDGEANAKYAVFFSSLSDPIEIQLPELERYVTRALLSSYRGPYLVRALEELGDAYSFATGKELQAIDTYKKALSLAKTPAEKSTALVSIMYLQIDPNKAAARETAQELLGLKDATPEWVEMAKGALKEMDKPKG